MTKVVILVTNAHELQGHPTGLWIEEAATPYYMFREAGFDVEFASPKGGPVPIDATSMSADFFTDPAKKFMTDGDAFGKLCHSTAIAKVDLDSVDALYIAGGHGVCVDFVGAPAVSLAIEKLYAADKVVAADCHGPIALAEARNPDGTPLVAGKTVTGFANSEEDAVQLTSKVPFLIETKFKELGAKYEKGADWSSKICCDGKLVTGQNPQSSHACAQQAIDLLK